MRGSDLDARISIQRNDATEDPDYGTKVDNWVDVYARVPAQVLDVLPSKAERTAQEVRMQTSPARVRTRYLSGVTADMRLIVHRETDHIMQIVGGPAMIGRREWLEMVCEEYSA